MRWHLLTRQPPRLLRFRLRQAHLARALTLLLQPRKLALQRLPQVARPHRLLLLLRLLHLSLVGLLHLSTVLLVL